MARQTTDGGFIIGGSSSSGVSGNKTTEGFGGYDFWVLKLDADGQKVWEATLGSNGNDELWTIEETPDGCYLVGGSSASGESGNKGSPHLGGLDYWVVKLGANGELLWERTYGGTGDDDLRAIHPTIDGYVYLAGTSDSPVSGHKTHAWYGRTDFWVLKLDLQGNIVWDRAFGSENAERLRVFCPTSDGHYLLGGDTGAPDYWLVKMDSEGNEVWDRSFGGIDAEYLWSVIETSGGYVLAGASQSYPSGNKTSPIFYSAQFGFAPDYWLLKVDSAGNKIWENSFGGVRNDSCFFVRETTNGFLAGGSSASDVSGNKTSPSTGFNGAYDYWAVKLDPTGKKVWELALGGNGSDVLTQGERTTNGYVLFGYSSSGISGNKTTPQLGGFDFWIVKLEGPPSITLQPQSQTVAVGDPVTFTMTAVGAPPLRYQWLFNGMAIVGATNQTLSLFNTSHGQAGLYTAVASNDFGAVTSSVARLSFNFLTLKMYAGLTIDGELGQTYRIEYVPGLGGETNWQTLATVRLTNSPFLYFDDKSATQPRRFYRALLIP